MLVKKAYNHFFAITIMLFSVTVLIRESLGDQKTFSISQDAEFHLGPLFSIMSRQIHLNIWPNYAPQLIMGVPLYNNQQFSPFYPFYFLSGRFFQNPENASASLNLIAILHIYIFALGGYFLMTALKVSTSLAALGGVFIAVNAQNEFVMGWVNIIAPYAWVPTIVAFFIRFLRRPNQFDAFGFSIALFLLVSASPAQPLIHTFYIVLIILLFKYFAVPWSQRIKYIESSIAQGIISALFSLALLLPIILPIITTQDSMIRWIGKYGALHGSEKMSFEAFVYDQLGFNEIKNILLEAPNTHTNGNPYLGVVVTSLLVLGVVTAVFNKNWELRAFTFISVYCLFSLFGESTIFGHLNYHLPLINRIREPTRFLQVLNFTAPVCGLLALQLLMSKFSIGKKNLTRVMVPSVLLLVFSWGSNFTSYSYSGSTVLQENWNELQPIYSMIDKLDPARQYKVAYAGDLNYQNASMYGSYMDMYSLNAYFNPAPEDRMQYVYQGGFLNNIKYSELLGVKYILCKKCTEQIESSLKPFKVISKIGNISLLESDGAYPYLYAQNGVDDRVLNSEDLMNSLKNNEVSTPRIYADSAVKRIAAPTKYFTCNFSPGPVYQEREARAECHTKSVVLLNEFYSSDLKITANGKRLTTFKVNGNMTGFELAKGTHHLEIDFQPLIMLQSYIISSVLIAICLFLGLIRFKRTRNLIQTRK